MEDIFIILVLNQSWKWLLLLDRFFSRHWRNVCYGVAHLGELLCFLMIKWKDCFVCGCNSLFDLGTAALLVIVWSFLISLTSMSCVLYLFLSMGTAVCAVRYLGYTHGLLIVGVFTILVIRMYANFWIVGPLLIIGGFFFSLNHTRFVVLLATVYALYNVKHQVGWSGVLVSINLAFISCDALIFMLKWFDDSNEKTQFEEQRLPISFDEYYIPEKSKFCVPVEEVEHVGPCKISSKLAVKSTFINRQKKDLVISIPVVKNCGNAAKEMKRIFRCADHYEILGFCRYKKINITMLKKEYKKKAMLVHPDKNMGNRLANESFKKLQCAYEVLSDSVKKRDYDEQLRKEESKSLSRKSASTNYCSEESRHVQCTKCGYLHVWVCTNRTKWKARWCQDCNQYHEAKDGDGWVEYKETHLPDKVKFPRAFVFAQNKIFDVSEWAICQGMTCRPNTHHPSFHVKIVGSDKTQKCNSSKCPSDSNCEMKDEEKEFNLWLQQALASGLFCETFKRRKSWTRFKLSQIKVKKQWNRMSRWHTRKEPWMVFN